jgi:hypothetical protein
MPVALHELCETFINWSADHHLSLLSVVSFGLPYQTHLVISKLEKFYNCQNSRIIHRPVFCLKGKV